MRMISIDSTPRQISLKSTRYLQWTNGYPDSASCSTRESNRTILVRGNSFNKHMYCEEIVMSRGFPDGSDSKESACNAGDLGLIPV